MEALNTQEEAEGNIVMWSRPLSKTLAMQEGLTILPRANNGTLDISWLD